MKTISILKVILCGFILLSLSLSCSKDSDPEKKVSNEPKITSITPTAAKVGHEITINGEGFGDEPEKVNVKFAATVKWRFDNDQVGIDVKSIAPDKIVVEVPARATTGTLTVSRTVRERPDDHLSEEVKHTTAQFTVLPSWTRKSDIGGGPRNLAIGFSIGNKGYTGLGFGGASFKKDFWEYNPATDQWTQKKSYPGNGSTYAIAFTINGKAYVGGGSDNTQQLYTDFWEYDPQTDEWTRRADIPQASDWPMYVALNGKGYVFGLYHKSYEYDPVSNSWTQRPSIPLPSEWQWQTDAYASFVVNGKAYACVGFNHSILGKGTNLSPSNVFEFDPVATTWTPKKYFLTAGIAGNSLGQMPSCFVIGNKAYIGLGYVSWQIDIFEEEVHRSNVLYEYNPENDTWRRAADFAGDPRSAAVGFAIGDKGYFASGFGSVDGRGTQVTYSDLWEYEP